MREGVEGVGPEERPRQVYFSVPGEKMEAEVGETLSDSSVKLGSSDASGSGRPTSRRSERSGEMG